MDPDSGFLDQFAFEDEDVQSSAREKRMEEAFMKSKDAYKNEFKYITSQWYLEQHSSATQSGPLNVDFTINHLFASRRYNEALALTKAQLDIPHKRGESFEANERELLDIGLRCCLECQDKDSALELAERSRSKWKQVPTLALTASKAFLLTGRPRGLSLATCMYSSSD
ncbi:hypothetical protein SISSUDRAFT_109827 [Sistotremastrum suecicum HHB10207 ss-3]|uniref:Uncharacterized protein n=1 Tax=Sistotremastrum suecicum HHB10207 ss-3 TaxID=1314776 RepID=A0A166GYY5_9AGAM|nr:hypothetical protein SISSUDRAFT_109827 [Sistotremastrum suecicum HHB10207 ss-3]